MDTFSCLAIDMGASNIRIILGVFSGRLEFREIHRFENKMELIDGHYRWNLKAIHNGIRKGIRKALETAPGEISSIGVDSWGVDFVMLDKNGEFIEYPVTYRDDRINGMPEEWDKYMSKEETFKRTGINFYPFNSLFQFMSIKNSTIHKKAGRVLFIADYINYFLSGNAVNELTLSSTTQMLNAHSFDWDKTIIKNLGIKPSLLTTPVKNGVIIGNLKEEFGGEGIKVTLVPGHDSAGTLLSIPNKTNNYAFLATGTWCVMGTESTTLFDSEQALNGGITNEVAANGNFRPLKNLMGLWLIQKLRESFGGGSSFEEIEQVAANTPASRFFIDTSDEIFYNPKDMKQAFDEHIHSKYRFSFSSEGEYYRCAYDSLAVSFNQCLKEFEKLRGKKFECIHITGGGSQSKLLCQLTANTTGLAVHAGPVEGASIGNLLSQALTFKFIPSIEEGKKIVANSFEVQEYKPEGVD